MGKVTWLSACKEYCARNGNWIVPKRDTPEYDAIHAIYRELVEAKARDPLSPCEDDTPDVKAVREVLQIQEETDAKNAYISSHASPAKYPIEVFSKRGRKKKHLVPTRTDGEYLISFT